MDQLGHHPEEDKELNGSAGPLSRGRQGTEWVSWVYPEEDKELNGSAGPLSRG